MTPNETDLAVTAVALLVMWGAFAVAVHSTRPGRRRKSRPVIPPGSNETIPITLDQQFEEIRAMLWDDPALRAVSCKRPALPPFDSFEEARATITDKGQRVRRCTCGRWHVIHVRPSARR